MTMTSTTMGRRPDFAPSEPAAVSLEAMDVHLDAAMLGQPADIRATLSPIASGGQRLRSRMAWSAAHLGPAMPDTHRIESLMAALELLHLATLVHDDMIDGDLERRGHPSLFAAFGEGTSVVAGDRLIGNAFELAADISARCASGMARCLMSLCDGQQHEELCVRAGAWTAEDYWRSVDGKTASLFAFAVVAGGEVGGAEATTLGSLQDFGMAFGRGYQLLDDLVDLPTTPPGRQLVRALAPVAEGAGSQDLGPDLILLAEEAGSLFSAAAEAAASLPGEAADALFDLAQLGVERTQRLADDLRG